MEPEPAKRTIDHQNKNPDVKDEEVKQFLDKNTQDFSSALSLSSASSSSLSLEFGLDEKDIHFDNNPSAQTKFDGDLLSGPEPIYSPDVCPWSMLSASPPPETGPHLSPAAQTPGQPAGYDPNRIPSSVFSTKPTNPADWSVASNESLFSIQMGNNSFSHDSAILFGKSGELGRLDDWNNISSEAKSTNEVSSLPPVIEESGLVSGEVSRVGSCNSLTVRTTENHAKEEMAPADAVNVSDLKRAPLAETNLNSSSMPRSSGSNPRLSGESGFSGSSFAFPVLVSDGVKTGSLKKVTDTPEKPQLQPEVSKATTQDEAPQERWFSRFCCWSRCC